MKAYAMWRERAATRGLRHIRILFLTLTAWFFMAAAPVTPVAARQAPASFHDETRLPEGPESTHIEALIETVNTGDTDAVTTFLARHTTESFQAIAPLEVHHRAFYGAYRQTGGIDFYGIRRYTPPREGETVVIVRDRVYGGWHGIVLRFDEGEERRIAGIGFSPARPPTIDESSLTQTQLIEETRALIERGCERDAFSGAVLLAHEDQILLETACGEASKRFHVPNNVETKFNLGSMNKMFTAVAIAQLVEQGRITYDDPISRYVDETWLPRSITDRVTIHHLLTHTSGLGSYFNETFMQSSRARFRDVDDYKPLVQGDTLAFEPGARFRYSNTGMLLLGVVIEQVTGQSYFDYVREHIYAPAGMTNTDSYAMDEPVENLAIGYEPDPESAHGWRNNLFEHVIMGGPAGGGFSTVRDLHRFALALQNGTLVSAETLQHMWTDYSGAAYGYGFGVEEGPAGLIVGHSGGFFGINSNLDIYPETGYVVVALSNYGQAAEPFVRRIQQLIARTSRS